MHNKRLTRGGGTNKNILLWEVVVYELNTFCCCVEEGNTHKASQISLAVRAVTAVPDIFPDYPCGAEASGKGGSVSLPKCRGTPV